MIEDANLKHFITEDLFLLAEDIEDSKSAVSTKEYDSPEPKPETVKEPAPAAASIATPKLAAPNLTNTTKTPSISTPKPAAVTHEIVVMVLPMNSKDKELLTNLLKAIDKTEKDVHLINSFSELNVGYKKLLSFGYLNELKYKLDLPLESYKKTKHENGEVLVASPLSSLHDNRAEKAALWKCLQEMFL